MSEQVKFTEKEQEVLRQAMKKSGIFLKISEDFTSNVEVQAVDGNDGWKTIETLDRCISTKINTWYKGQNGYKAPLKDGFRQVSLAWFVAVYC